MPDKDAGAGKPVQKKKAGLSGGLKRQRRAPAPNLQDGLLTGVEEIVSRSFVGQAVAAAHQPEDEGGSSVPAEATADADTATGALPSSRIEAPAAAEAAPVDSAEPAKAAADMPGGGATPAADAGSEPDAVEAVLADAASPAAAPAPVADADAAAAAEVEPAAGAEPDLQDTDEQGAPTAPAAEEPARPPARRRAASSGTRRAASAEKSGWAHRAVLDSWTASTFDVKLRRNQWKTHPFRFAPDLAEALGRRVAEDRESSGRSLTVAQVVNAAMASVLPAELDEQIALGEEFFEGRLDVPAGKQASHRISPEVYEVVSRLPDRLKAAGRGRITTHIYSAALERFLKELEAEGPLK
ncbi:hypothetical protein BIV57_12755 [Mangrovactinospora gilvigrisea]|uniref:Uncharacterized protein n=1 Tax=Mangrovactinospora gilvigrisea TaxID=1428644 RepID=A0A1J7BEI1_9ACTN|nr:hypothetical protein [Mangrovactinospora gilvigrisea]OIV37103.1 hypothetical protein BIV57_12755 [Mangrovactinospora gilvigrisea]